MMNESRLERLSPLTGAASVVLMVIGVLVFNYYEFLPPAEKIAEFLNGNASLVSTGGYIGALAAFFLIWFTGSLRSALINREGGTGQLSTIAFGGGLAASIALGISFIGIFAAGLRAGAPEGISPIGAVSMYDFWTQLTGQLFSIFMAVFIGATAALSLRSGFFPAWFGWVSVLVAVGLLTPFAYAMLAIAFAWLLVVSIWLYLKGAPEGERSALVEPA
jgi:hypothetical protein